MIHPNIHIHRQEVKASPIFLRLDLSWDSTMSNSSHQQDSSRNPNLPILARHQALLSVSFLAEINIAKNQNVVRL